MIRVKWQNRKDRASTGNFSAQLRKTRMPQTALRIMGYTVLGQNFQINVNDAWHEKCLEYIRKTGKKFLPWLTDHQGQSKSQDNLRPKLSKKSLGISYEFHYFRLICSMYLFGNKRVNLKSKLIIFPIFLIVLFIRNDQSRNRDPGC